MTKRMLSTAALLALGLAGAAHAAERPRGPMPDPYGEATVARADALARAGTDFDAADTDHDGKLSAAEMHAAMPGPGGPGGPPPPPPPPGADAGRGPAGGPPMGMMMRADTNGDGVISREEATAAAGQRFDMADANHDGQLTKKERDEARKAMRARWQDRRGGDMGGMNHGGPGGGMGDSGNDD